MRGEEMLTLGQLLETEGSLGHPRLVALSACETGLYDINRNADEFIGLPSTLMQIGAMGVLSSLWQVDDLATALLMAKFYDQHLGEGRLVDVLVKPMRSSMRRASKRSSSRRVSLLTCPPPRLPPRQLA
jgi:CHAT domain